VSGLSFILKDKQTGKKADFILIKKVIIAASVFYTSFSSSTLAEDFKTPDIFVLGDSQILFGAGGTFQNFFENIEEKCGISKETQDKLAELSNPSVGVLGVRSTGINSWVRKDAQSQLRICTIDPNWHKNASTFGVINQSDERFLQLGQEEPFKFCEQDKSAFEVMFAQERYKTKLFVTFFLGNSAKLWSQSRAEAKQDALAFATQIPQDMPCIYMTTAPAYRQGNIDRRTKAQENIEQAFKETNNHCAFVAGITPETIEANLGNNLHFKTDETGKVKDPFHPNDVATKSFLALKTADICNAIITQLDKKSQPSKLK